MPSMKAGATTQNNRQTLIDYRRANNLCFKCGEKFTPGHQCKMKQLNSMEEEEGNEDTVEEEEQEEKEPAGIEAGNQGDTELEISMNALTGSIGYNTLRIPGIIKGRKLSILIDSGSTHSFVTPPWAKEGVELVQTHPLEITVANGERLYSRAKSNQLAWKMQGELFSHDFRVLNMGGSDMVLGVDWMRRFSPVEMDFRNITLSFEQQGRRVVLQGEVKEPSFKVISDKKMQKLKEKNPEMQGEIYLLTVENEETKVPEELKELLREYTDVFSEPKGMPP
ncbi:hypothetical protein GQ457_05G033260 [Hibiscus cannabinus]